MSKKYFYLSFATDTKFLGGCVVEADNFMQAHQKTSFLGINPGGEVIGSEVPWEAEKKFPLDTLMSRADINRIDKAVSIKDMKLNNSVETVCEKDNPTTQPSRGR